MRQFILGLDQGTTGFTAIVFDENWNLIGKGYREIRQFYPKAGWVEHDALDIWDACRAAVRQALDVAGVDPREIVCIGLDHEGESVVMWDRLSGEPVSPAIVWQDRRTAFAADQLSEQYGDLIRERTGLMVDSYFSALKYQWILENVPAAKELLNADRLMAGNMDCWLVWKLTHGKLHITDASTASRTMLLNLSTGDWDPNILELLGIPISILPEIRDSAGIFGETDPMDFLGIQAPITGLLNDQQAALFGQTCFEPGMVKTTYGTGCFMLMNTGEVPVFSPNGILTTVAWQLDGKHTYALDGGIYISGAATQWLRDGLGIISSAGETAQIAEQVGCNGGVYFVPAFSGLAAPYWDSYARGMMIGITGGTTREHIVRATLESTAFQVYDLLKLMKTDSQVDISVMRCDGGASANRFLMQFQADMLGIPIHVPEITDTTALGAAFMAAIGAGLCSRAELSGCWKLARSYEPLMNDDERQELLANWHRAVERAQYWAMK